jgi:nucleotide-binding universal stress UspA family protein
MHSSLLVLVDLSDRSQRLVKYAARLAMSLGGRMVLLHVGPKALWKPGRYEQAATAKLAQWVSNLPLPVTINISSEPFAQAVADAEYRYQPLLLLLGTASPASLHHRLLQDKALPMLRSSGYPLLFVPDTGAVPPFPRHLAIAADEEPARLGGHAGQLRQVLLAWQATATVVHVPGAEQGATGFLAWQAVRQAAILPLTQNAGFCETLATDPVVGIRHAVADTRADLLLLLARPRSFQSRHFQRSVTMQVLHDSTIPVLLLPTKASIALTQDDSILGIAA